MPPNRQNLTHGIFNSGGFSEEGSRTRPKTCALFVILI